MKFKLFVYLLLGAVALLGSTSSFAVEYYVSSANGSNSNDGLTPATPWRTLGRVANERNKPQGADVYLEAGSVFENQTLTVGWGGRESDWVEIGCYRRQGGRAVDCLSSDRLPEINGTFERGCAQHQTCKIDEAGAVPSSSWAGLVQLNSSYVAVRDVALRDAAGIPLNVASNRGLHHFLFEDLRIEHTGRKVIQFGRGARYGVVRRVKASEFNFCRKYKYPTCFTGAHWPGAITMSDSLNAYIVFEDNDVNRGFGEGFNCLRSSHVVIRNNRVGDVHSNAYYLDTCSNSIVENNIAWGDKDNNWESNYAFAGVAINSEDYPEKAVREAVNNIVRNNLIVGFGSCVKASQWPAAQRAGYQIGFHVYGNTCIGQHMQSVFFSERNLPPANITSIVVKNNIFYSPNAGDVCQSPRTNKIDFDHNLWFDSPGASCSGTNDIVGDPLLVAGVDALLQRNYLNPPTPKDLALRSSSPVIGAGRALMASLPFDTPQYPFALPGTKSCDDAQTLLKRDFHCVPRQNPPSMGAIDRVDYPPKPPVLFAAGGE